MARREMTPAQKRRQHHREDRGGRYAKVNPCYVCDKSAGDGYWSHRDTDIILDDDLLCLCTRCENAVRNLNAGDAIAWARARREKLGLDAGSFTVKREAEIRTRMALREEGR